MQPLALAQDICADYRRYIETTFPILDDSLRRQIDKKITSEYLLWAGRFTITRSEASGVLSADNRPLWPPRQAAAKRKRSSSPSSTTACDTKRRPASKRY